MGGWTWRKREPEELKYRETEEQIRWRVTCFHRTITRYGRMRRVSCVRQKHGPGGFVILRERCGKVGVLIDEWGMLTVRTDGSQHQSGLDSRTATRKL